MPSHSARSLQRLVLLPLLAVVLGIATLLPAPAPVAAQTLPTSAAHPFGDPIWFPLRSPARLGCAVTLCPPGKGHGYWALDLIDDRGAPVYAAGAGIAHIGGDSGACAAQSGEVRGGRWVWVDHGGGVVTRYHHLDSIAIKEGQLVTPATRIGAMGHSGDSKPCSVNYLHFEVRHGGLDGIRVDPGQLRVCLPSGAATLPAALGATSWDDRKIHTSPRVLTPTSTSDCITSKWLGSPPVAGIAVHRGDRSATVSWPMAPAGTDRAQVFVEIWRPSIKTWRPVELRFVAGQATEASFTGLDNGRSYRATVAWHNAAGTGLSSPRRTVVPAGLPGRPRSPRYLTWPHRDYVHYGWNRPEANGSPVTSFTAARRCATKSGSYGAWRTHSRRAASTYYNFRGLSKMSRCQVKVRATSSVGTGVWSAVSTIAR